MGKETLRRKVDEGKHLKIHGRSREGTGAKKYLTGPIDEAIMLKLRFLLTGLGMPERRMIHTNYRGEEQDDASNGPYVAKQ